MKILISQLPQSPWWQNGVPLYDDNPAMRLSAMPDQSILEKERSDLILILNDLNIEIIELPFPSIYNADPIKHDFVYIRDPFITNQKGKAVILRMKEPNRRGESTMARQLLQKMGMEITRIPDKPGLYAEGGEFYFCAKENILFSGQCRNSESGMEAVAEALNITELVIIQSHSYHLDTYFAPVLNQEGHICALILCLDIVSVKSSRDLKKFAAKKNIPIIDIPLEDAIGTATNPGSFAVNALSLPGVLIGPSHFSDRNIDDRLADMGVQRIVTPTTQFALSGGSIHCITNEI